MDLESYETKMKRNNIKQNKGAVFLLLVLMFAAVTLTITIGMARPVFSQVAVSETMLNSKISFYAAEGAVEDTIHRFNKSMTVPATNTIDYTNYSASVSVTDTLDGKEIDVSSDVEGVTRNLLVNIFKGEGVSFNYGVQTGEGGFYMDNNVTINGNIYANGNVIGTSNVSVTGTVIAANSAALSADQVNETPETPVNSIVFGQNSSNKDLAQSFKVSTSTPLNKIQLYVKKVGSPKNRTVRITNNSSGQPSSVTLTEASLSASSVTTNYGWVEVFFPDTVTFNPSSTYWIVIEGDSSSSKYFEIGANSSYANGEAKIGDYGSSWTGTSPAGLDAAFKVYLGGLTSLISNVIVGSSGSGDARAHTVRDSVIHGDLYCQEGSGNNKSCDTSLSDPTPQPFPISEPVIQSWKDEAEAAGTIEGDHTISTAGTTLGPTKINGNLIVNNHMILTGTVWVTGNILMDNNVEVELDSGYGSSSGVLMSDGYIDLNNNIQFTSTTSGYTLLLTTSSCPNDSYCGGMDAITLNNNIEAVILNAQNGTIVFNNNAQAKAATAYKIDFGNNVTITYESGLANANFSSGPAGSWNILRWEETEN